MTRLNEAGDDIKLSRINTISDINGHGRIK